MIVHATATGAPCGHYSEADTFECPKCGRMCCYCAGVHDEQFGHCDDCWSKREGAILYGKHDADCATCNGDGLVIVGWNDDAYENIEGPCPDCQSAKQAVSRIRFTGTEPRAHASEYSPGWTLDVPQIMPPSIPQRLIGCDGREEHVPVGAMSPELKRKAEELLLQEQSKDSPNQTETYKRQPATSGKLHEGPPAREVAAMEAPSRSRGEAPTGGALLKPAYVASPRLVPMTARLRETLDHLRGAKDSGVADVAASAVASADRPQPAAPITTYPSGICEFTAPDGSTFGRF